MASLKDLKNRIASVRSTQKITQAMKMVAAAKLRRAQEAAEAARPYAERMDEVMRTLAGAVSTDTVSTPLLTGTGRQQTYLLVVATSERGLCGGFNAGIVRAARRRIRELLSDGKDVKILCVGKKGRQMLLREHGERIVDTIDMSQIRRIGYEDADEIGRRLRVMFEEEAFDVALLFYARFRTAMTQIPTEQQVIPVPVPEAGETSEEKQQASDAAFEYEPEEEAILAELLPRNVSVQLFRALLENAASEQGARMTAMDSATRNAGELIDDLTLEYNRTRQAEITTELIEVISGAEAL